MVTLLEKVYSSTQRGTVELRITGREITDWISIKGGDHDDNPVPYIDVELPTYEGIVRGEIVTLDAGYDNLHIRVFTGGVFARGNEDPDALRTQVFVRGRTDDAGVTIEATASLLNPPIMWPPIPPDQYIDYELSDSLIWEAVNADEIAVRDLEKQATIPDRPAGNPLSHIVHCLGDLKGAYRSYKIPARDLSGMMIKAAMAGILDDSGVANYIFDFDDYELAPDGVLVDRGPGADALDLLMLLRGVSARQGPDGIVIFKVVDERPSSTAAFSYRSDDLDLAFMIENPGKVKVPYNPYLQRGQTIEIVDEATQVNGFWYLRGHEFELGQQGDWSYLDLIGGENFGSAIGINPEAHFSYWIELEYVDDVLTVIVQFDAQSSFDTDGVLTDADIAWSDNQTPDLISGTGFRKKVVVPFSTIVEPWIVTVTVTDEDGLIGTEEQTIIFQTTGSAVHFPTIGCAANTYGLFSSPTDTVNGWTDFAESNQVAVGLRPPDGINFGQALYGYLDGHVELTRDGNASRIAVPSLAGNSQIRFIAWDWRNTKVCWVLTDLLQLWVCLDMDIATPVFGLYGGQSLRTTLARPSALGNLIGLPGEGGVYVFGATGTGFPLIAYDASLTNSWVTQIVLGDLLTDGAGASNLRIVDYTAPGYGGETMILGNAGGRANGSIAVYHSNDPPGPSKIWTRATGLPAGLVDGRAMLPNGPLAPVTRIAVFGDAGFEDSVFKSGDGIAYIETTGIIPAGKVTRHAMWVSDVLTGLPAIDGVYLFALENLSGTGGIYKSVDECSTELDPVRDLTTTDPMPTNSDALQLSIGAPFQTIPNTVMPLVTGNFGGSGTLRDAACLISGHWKTFLDLPNGLDNTRPRPYCPSTLNWFITDTVGFPQETLTMVASLVSNDQNDSWAPSAIGDEDPSTAGVGPIGGIIGIAKAANGWLWGYRHTGNLNSDPIRVDIAYSPDNGATWVLTDALEAPPNSQRFGVRIACHPLNPNIVALIGLNLNASERSVIRVTNNATVGAASSWSTNDAGAPGTNNFAIDESDAQIGINFLITNSGRFHVILAPAILGANPSQFWTSDNQGLLWTKRLEISIADGNEPWVILAGYGNGKLVAFRVKDNELAQAYVSIDDGLTWQAVGPFHPRTNGGNDWSAKYHSSSDTLIVCNGENSGVWRVAALSPVSALGAWVDYTFDLPAGVIQWDGLAVSP